MKAEETEETGDGSLFPKKQRERRTVPCSLPERPGIELQINPKWI